MQAKNIFRRVLLTTCLIVILISAGKAQKRERDIWVLVIGISEYEHVTPLTYADDDAILFYNYIKSFLGDQLDMDHTRILLNKDASGAAIIKGFEWLIRNSNPGDIAYIYYSGHGGQENITVRKRGFLLGYNSYDASFISGGNFPMVYLEDMLLTLSVQNVKTYFFADACHSGKNEEESFDYLNEKLGDEVGGITKILSAQGDEKSFEHAKWGGGHGVFTYYLIKGLLGEADNAPEDRIVSVRELTRYLNDSVPSGTNYRQNPKIVAKDPGSILSVVRNEIRYSFDIKNSVNDIDFIPLASRGIDRKENSEYENMIDKYVRKLKSFSYLDNQDTGALSILHDLLETDIEDEIKIQIRDKLYISLLDYTQIIINDFMSDYHSNDSIAGSQELSNALTSLNIANEYFNENKVDQKKLTARKAFINGWLTHNNFHGGSAVAEDLVIAASEISTAIVYDPDAAYLYYLKGILLQHASNDLAVDDEKITDATQMAINLAPNWPWPYNTMGHIYVVAEDYEQAIEYYKMADKRSPFDGQYLSHIGDVYAYSVDDDESAYKYWLRVIQKDPGSIDDWITLLDYGYKPDSLINAAKGYIEENPADTILVSSMYELLGDYFANYAKKPDIKKTSYYYQKAAEINHDEASYYYLMLGDYFATSIRLNDGLSDSEHQFLDSAYYYINLSAEVGDYSSYYYRTNMLSLLDVDIGYHQEWSLIQYYSEYFNYDWSKAIKQLEEYVSEDFVLNNPLHTYYESYYYERIWAYSDLALLYKYGLNDRNQATFYANKCIESAKKVEEKGIRVSKSDRDIYNEVIGNMYQLILDDNVKALVYFSKMIDRTNWATWKGLALSYFRLEEFEKFEQLYEDLEEETLFGDDDEFLDGYDNTVHSDLIFIKILHEIESQQDGVDLSTIWQKGFMDVPLLRVMPELKPFSSDIEKYIKKNWKYLVKY